MQIVTFLFSGSVSVSASTRSGSRTGVRACVVQGSGIREGTGMGGEYNFNQGGSLSG